MTTDVQSHWTYIIVTEIYISLRLRFKFITCVRESIHSGEPGYSCSAHAYCFRETVWPTFDWIQRKVLPLSFLLSSKHFTI